MNCRILALTGLLLSTTPALAQTQPEGWTPSEIIVTGTRDDGYATSAASTLRTPVPILETPQSVQVLTRTLLDEQQLTTLAEAVRNISGVVTALPSEAVLANPIVRGFEFEVFIDLYGAGSRRPALFLRVPVRRDRSSYNDRGRFDAGQVGSKPVDCADDDNGERAQNARQNLYPRRHGRHAWRSAAC